jgi:hypothetical protein
MFKGVKKTDTQKKRFKKKFGAKNVCEMDLRYEERNNFYKQKTLYLFVDLRDGFC